MEVLGFKVVKFKAKDGNLIQGIKVFVSDDAIRVDSGIACDSLFLSDGLLIRNGLCADDIQVGQRLRIGYNKFGKIQSVSLG